jgi:histidinol phosphatase-like enzyme
MKRLLLLDHTALVQHKNGPGIYINNRDDMILVPGILGALEPYVDKGYSVAICSNQGGVEKGHLAFGACQSLFGAMFELSNYWVQAIWFCPLARGSTGSYAIQMTMPYEPKTYTKCQKYATTGYRMPQAGMILAAMDWFRVTPEQTTMVGLQPEAYYAAADAGVKKFVHSSYFVEKAGVLQ